MAVQKTSKKTINGGILGKSAISMVHFPAQNTQQGLHMLRGFLVVIGDGIASAGRLGPRRQGFQVQGGHRLQRINGAMGRWKHMAYGSSCFMACFMACFMDFMGLHQGNICFYGSENTMDLKSPKTWLFSEAMMRLMSNRLIWGAPVLKQTHMKPHKNIDDVRIFVLAYG